MNKRVFRVTSLGESDDYYFWKDKSYLERLAALEKLRRTVFGYGSSSKRLQRVFKVTQLKES